MSETMAFVGFAIVSILLFAGAKTLDDRDRRRAPRSSEPPSAPSAPPAIATPTGERLSHVSDHPPSGDA